MSDRSACECFAGTTGDQRGQIAHQDLARHRPTYKGEDILYGLVNSIKVVFNATAFQFLHAALLTSGSTDVIYLRPNDMNLHRPHLFDVSSGLTVVVRVKFSSPFKATYDASLNDCNESLSAADCTCSDMGDAKIFAVANSSCGCSCTAPFFGERLLDFGNARNATADNIILGRHENSRRIIAILAEGQDEACVVLSEDGAIVQDEWMTITFQYDSETNAVSLKKNFDIIGGPVLCSQAPSARNVTRMFIGKSNSYNNNNDSDYFNGEILTMFVVDEPMFNLTRVCKIERTVANQSSFSYTNCSTLQSSTWSPDAGTQYHRDQKISAFGGVEGHGALAVDGNADTCSQTWRETSPWWRMDFDAPRLVVSLRVYGRTDFRQEDLDGFQVHVGIWSQWHENPPCAVNVNVSKPGANASTSNTRSRVGAGWVDVLCEAEGRYLHIVLPGINRSLALCEVEVYGLPNSQSNAIAGILPNCTACLAGL